MNIFEAIRKDHDVQRELLDRLLATEGASPQRKEIYQELKDHLKTHALAEERYFYNPLMKHDISQPKARHSVAEHNELDEIMADLDEMEMSSPGWLTRAKTLAERLRHHLEEEEREVFQIAGRALKEKHKEELADAYRGTMKDKLDDHA